MLVTPHSTAFHRTALHRITTLKHAGDCRRDRVIACTTETRVIPYSTAFHRTALHCTWFALALRSDLASTMLILEASSVTLICFRRWMSSLKTCCRSSPSEEKEKGNKFTAEGKGDAPTGGSQERGTETNEGGTRSERGAGGGRGGRGA